jgi:uncharacterized membrane protein YkvA (DUF1232 family)
MSENNNNNEFNKEYSDSSFWSKVKKYAIMAGREIIEKALILYYCLQDSDTPAWAKGIIISALGYFIFPLDAIPDMTPAVGYADDLGVLAGALASVAVHIKDEHKKQALEQLEIWFGK